MALYVVQAQGGDEASLERAAFIKDGFSWGAFAFGPFWLLYRRLWLALLVWVVAEGAFIALIGPHVDGPMVAAGDLLAHLWLGFEGQGLRVAKAARKAGIVDLVEGRDRDEAEARFFRRMVPEATPEPGPWGPRV